MAAKNLGSTHQAGAPSLSLGEQPHADSAGQPWAGRSFESNDFAGDDGKMPEQLRAALSAFHNKQSDITGVIDAFRESRLLIPLIAEAGEVGVTPAGKVVDKTQELSIVTVAAPDGRKALPVFSSVEAMGRWSSDARPVPADGVRVALAAAGDETSLVVLDPGSDTQFVLRRPAVWAIAQSLPWQPAWSDPEINAVFERSIAEVPEVVSVELADGDPSATLVAPETLVTLRLVPGLDRERVDALLLSLQRLWGQSEVIAERVDSLALKLASQ
ncbi:SseB family protein [Lysinibacter sp. HNR]|uniref:SseB family protein n=1 Tax=Lysinibacter sp. HNR TaxID=3031408 RepID=UPI002435BBC6|nr:SseB family protein [Lysinibacter sp. HNR]WGD37905.1 SseB family protein [Lysinibacter sp. HNR]